MLKTGAGTGAGRLKQFRYLEYMLMALFILLLGAGTYSRNLVWKSDISLWSDVIKKSERKARPYSSLSYAFLQAGDFDQAVVMGEKGVALNPNYADARLNLAVSYIEKRLYEKAIPHLLTAMSLEPEMVKLYAALGAAYSGIGRIDDAISVMQKGLKLNPASTRMKINLAVAYAVRGMYELAIWQLLEILAERPDDYEAHYNLGIAYGLKGMHEASFSELKEALRLKPDHTWALYYLGELYRTQLNDAGAAVAQYRQILLLKRQNDPFTAMAEKRIREITRQQ